MHRLCFAYASPMHRLCVPLQHRKRTHTLAIDLEKVDDAILMAEPPPDLTEAIHVLVVQRAVIPRLVPIALIATVRWELALEAPRMEGDAALIVACVGLQEFDCRVEGVHLTPTGCDRIVESPVVGDAKRVDEARSRVAAIAAAAAAAATATATATAVAAAAAATARMRA